MHETANKAQERMPSELEIILDSLTSKNEIWSRLTMDLQTGLEKISRYKEPEDPQTNPQLKSIREETIIERLKEQLDIQEGYIHSLEFYLRHLRTIV